MKVQLHMYHMELCNFGGWQSMWCQNYSANIYYLILVLKTLGTNHGWGNHPGKSGHGLTNILTLYISFEHKHYVHFRTTKTILQSRMRPDY